MFHLYIQTIVTPTNIRSVYVFTTFIVLLSILPPFKRSLEFSYFAIMLEYDKGFYLGYNKLVFPISKDGKFYIQEYKQLLNA